MTDDGTRERHMRELADQLQFEVEKTAEGFSLRRRTGVSEPVEREGLTLDEAEGLLNRWKLRGLGGG